MPASKSCASCAACCRQYLIILLLIGVLASVIPFAAARPEGSHHTEKYCARSVIQQETCQKCAKITKSRMVYPMCCNEEEGVYKWCTDYVNFGDHAT